MSDKTDHLLERVRALIALASSPSVEEARTAAHKACELIREEELLIGKLSEDGRLRTVGGSGRFGSSSSNSSSASSGSSRTTHSSRVDSSVSPDSPESLHKRYGGKSVRDVVQDANFMEDLFKEAYADISRGKSERGHISSGGTAGLCGVTIRYAYTPDQHVIQFIELHSAIRMLATHALKSLCPMCVRTYIQLHPT